VELTLDIMQELITLALDKHIDLGYEGADAATPGVRINGNATMLRELVRNLVDNAINYTPSSAEQPGVITVRVLADRFSQVAVLQVEDSGPGIPQAERELVFQPFYRALGTGADGSGLGLPIVLEIAHQHGAIVTLEDANPGKPMPGARFNVRFSNTLAEAPKAIANRTD
jgi:two-component system, OmpR family, sensor histidine kinase TctE